jgi:hypothetical protein
MKTNALLKSGAFILFYMSYRFADVFHGCVTVRIKANSKPDNTCIALAAIS